MSNNNMKASEMHRINIYEIFKIVVKHVQKYSAAFTFLISFIGVIVSKIISFSLYLIEYGKTYYYGISKSLIDVSKENIFYDVLVKCAFALLIILLNIFLFFIWKGNDKTIKKIGYSLLLILIPDLIIVSIISFEVFHGAKHSISEIILCFIIYFFIGVVLFWEGIYIGISEYRMLKQKNETKASKSPKNQETSFKYIKISVVLFVMTVIVPIINFVYLGYNTARTQNEFKIIYSEGKPDYAVIYENPNKYVITQCKIEEEYICFTNLNIKQEIERNGVEYKWQRLSQKK